MDPSRVFSVDEVIVHYKYKMLELNPKSPDNGRDLALLRLDRDAVSAGLEPLCLPPGRKFPDDTGVKMGYTEGWGTDTDSTGECITGEEGPAPFQPCQARTIIPTKDGGPPQIHQGCVKGKSPTSILIKEHKAGLCARLKSHLRRHKQLKKHLMIPGVSEVVVLTSSEVERRCYHENRVGRDRRKAGWCATCRAEAVPGEFGYCGQLSINKTAEETLNTTSNWGFCLQSAACTRSEPVTLIALIALCQDEQWIQSEDSEITGDLLGHPHWGAVQAVHHRDQHREGAMCRQEDLSSHENLPRQGRSSRW